MCLGCACSMDNPGPELLRKSGKGAHDFFALPGSMLVASARDALFNGIQRWRNGSDDGIRIATCSGHRDLSVARSAHLRDLLTICGRK